jgi:phospholipase A1
MVTFGSKPPSGDPCAGIEDDGERLACYDARAALPPPRERSFLERHWDLYGDSRLFQPWPHRPNYVLPARWTSDANEAPVGGSDPGEVEPSDVQSVEAKFQISFKTKLLRHLFGGPADLWFGFTQQSHFQVYNASESRPFRETDFQPEAFVVFPLRRTWGSWTLRLIGVGFVHQSNGQSEPLSRSWNRVYAVAGIERRSLVFHVRPWMRVDSTSAESDDNPGITDLVGHMEVVAQWSPPRGASARGSHILTVRGTTNFDVGDHKGSLEANWFFPIHERLRAQLQVFTGYGENLLDYDHPQTTAGIGLLLFDPF